MGLEGPTQGAGTTYDNSNNLYGRTEEEQDKIRAADGFTEEDNNAYNDYRFKWGQDHRTFTSKLFGGHALTYNEFMKKNGRGPYGDHNKMAGTPDYKGGDLASVQGTGTNVIKALDEQDAKPGQDKAQADEDEITAKIKAFYDEMNKPLDLNDPKVKVILAGATNAARQDASSRGIQGGLAGANSEQAFTNAAAGLSQQRSALGLQGLQTASNRGLGLAGLNEQKYEFDARRNYDAMNAQYEQGKQANASGWGLVGGVAGGIIGGLGTQSFAGAAAGYQAGSSLGAGLAGSNYGPSPYTSSGSSGYNRGGGSRGGGLSGRGY